MANKKISELPYIDGGKISGNTLVPLVTYFSATTGDTVHTYITDLQNYLTSGITISGDFLPLTGGTVSGTTVFSDSSGTIQSIDSNSRLLYDSIGSGSIDWDGRTLFDASASSSVDYGNHQLNDSTTAISADWENRSLYDDLGTDALEWTSTNRKLLDVTSADAVNWNDRLLTKSDGSTVSFDWENGILTGQTNIESSTISATTYQNLPPATFSGGTVTGPTTFTNGLTANTISATTYQNLPTDVRVTGGTYSAGTVTFTNNTGGTFNVTGLTTGSTSTVSGDFLPLSGGTVTGGTIFQSGLTANTLNVGGVDVDITELQKRAIVVTGGTVSAENDKVYHSIGAGTTTYNDPTGVAGRGYWVFVRIGTSVIGGSSISINGLLSFRIYSGGSWATYNFLNAGTISSSYTPLTRTINSKPLSTDIILTATDVNALPISGGTVTGNTIFTSGLTANTLNVTGNTNVRGFTGTTGYISGSGQSILTVIGSGNSTTSPLFTVQGSSGELFSVNDSLVGSLFSVNDISGLPIMEVFSDNTTLWGSYQAPSLNTTTRTSLTAGTNTIYSIPTSAYTGAFYEYTLISTGTTGARAGQIMSIWSGTSANFTETSTLDIGTTTGVTFTVAVSGNNAVLSSSATTAGWTVKTIIRSI